jgi:hypothetical protein
VGVLWAIADAPIEIVAAAVSPPASAAAVPYVRARPVDPSRLMSHSFVGRYDNGNDELRRSKGR